MSTLYIECAMGAAGDMLMAALLELLPQPEAFITQMNALGLPGVRLQAQKDEKCGITGTHVQVAVHGAEEHSHDVGPHEAGHHHHHGQQGHGHTHEQAAHSHTGYEEIQSLVEGLALSPRVKADVLAVYRLIAEAEAHVHGRAVEQVHFHEVGAADAVADIVGVCLLMEQLAPVRVVASPVHVGSGQVRCAHGVLPVPAPATAYLLRGVPSYGGGIQGELCTPTGAALLRHFAAEYGPQPLMAVQAIGYGMGTKNFERANCLRVMLGEETAAHDEVEEISCNLDDMTGEALAYAQQLLLDAGALDVYVVPVQMKKGRPGQQLCCLCAPQKTEELAALMLRHTTSLGVRIQAFRRQVLQRRTETVQTMWGPVRLKLAEAGSAEKWKAEYEDVAKIADAQGVSLEEVYAAVRRARHKG